MAAAKASDDPAAGGEELARFLRAQDFDRYLSTLFVGAAHRQALTALYAFNVEIARVRDVVSDPFPGEMRLQWWRDLLSGATRGEGARHPVATALLAVIARYRLPLKAFLDLIEARSFDLYDDGIPDRDALEGYCGATASALIRLAGIVLADGEEPGAADAAGHAGVAYAITGLMRAFPWQARRGQLFFPADMMARHGLSREAALSGTLTPALTAVLAELRALARTHLHASRAAIGGVRPGTGAAFLPVCLVEPYLAAMERPGYDPFRTIISWPDWRKLLRMWREARRAP